MNVSINSPLALTGLNAVLGHFRSRLTLPLDEQHVQFSIDALNSKLIITALPFSTNGEVGKYRGVAEFAYGKVSLQQVLPYPILYKAVYPTPFSVMRSHLLNTYGIILEEGEFALADAPSHGLVNTDSVAFAPDAAHGLLTLTALASSPRWIAGTTLRLTVIPTNGPQRLNSLVSLLDTPSMDLLKDPALAVGSSDE